MPGTEPSSFARPASAAMPVTVPIVSKKSVSMIVKIIRIAVSSGSDAEHLGQVELAERREVRRDREAARDRR